MNCRRKASVKDTSNFARITFVCWCLNGVEHLQHTGATSRVECYAATHSQQGKTTNEDAFLIGHGPIPYAVLCDGAGHAQQAAKCALLLFVKLLGEATSQYMLNHVTWQKWVKCSTHHWSEEIKARLLAFRMVWLLAVAPAILEHTF